MFTSVSLIDTNIIRHYSILSVVYELNLFYRVIYRVMGTVASRPKGLAKVNPLLCHFILNLGGVIGKQCDFLNTT
jgi:hypothetical protein